MAEIEFKGINKEEFDKLREAFGYIASAKAKGRFNEEELTDLMSEKVLSHFVNPTKEEADEMLKQWKLNPNAELPWDFGSWYDALDSAELDYQSIEMCEDGTGKIVFEQLAWPCGGIDATVELIKAFGGEVTFNDAI